MDETLLLRDAEIAPSMDVLGNIVGKDIFSVYEKIYQTITSSEFELNPEWNFYKDGKAWLCKVTYKKKTVFWLSMWNSGIKISFYFTEKTRSGLLELAINDEIKQNLENVELIGKLIPLTLVVENEVLIDDLKKLIVYKKALK